VLCEAGCVSCDGASDYCDQCDTSGGYLFSNFTCVMTCPSGFSLDLDDDTRCILDGLRCPFGYEIDASGTECEPSLVVCESGFTINYEKTKCIPEPGDVIYFPFLTIFILMIVFILIGY
jgi:hypothetical protein